MAEPQTLERPEPADQNAESAGKRERTKFANRSAILDAARVVFAELGYEATTVRDIVRGTELASGTFYNYFKSKEEVYHALIDDGVAQVRPLLREARQQASDFTDFLRRAFKAYFNFVVRDSAVAALELRTPDRTRVRFDTPESVALFDELKADVASMIGDGLAPAVDPDFLTAACFGIAQEIAGQMMRRQPPDIDEAAAFATNMVLGGLDRLTRNT